MSNQQARRAAVASEGAPGNGDRVTDLLDNLQARRLFLWLHGLGDYPGLASRADGLPALVEKLGFVQIDSIRTVERAHHHILVSRQNSYRPAWLDDHVDVRRTLFENWTHDASFIPTRFFPYWKSRFRRTRDRMMKQSWWRSRIGDDPETVCRTVLNHIRAHGPVMARDLKSGNPEPPPGHDSGTAWWGWHPSKAALVFLWRTGKLAVTTRKGFQKVYDLTERVIPQSCREAEPTLSETVDWHCRSAIHRLGFATPGEIAAFWDALTPAEVRQWLETPGPDQPRPIRVQMADGGLRDTLGRPDLPDLLPRVPDPPRRIRFLSPFDPVVRDRKRIERLFDFRFRIEIFVPRAQRIYGYYVYPMLERDRFIGRIEMKADRDADMLGVTGLWLEPGISLTRGRRALIEAELDRWRRYCRLGGVDWTGSATLD